jgi:hypothetical protein
VKSPDCGSDDDDCGSDDDDCGAMGGQESIQVAGATPVHLSVTCCAVCTCFSRMDTKRAVCVPACLHSAPQVVELV